MIDGVDLSGQFRKAGVAQPQARLGQIAGESYHPFRPLFPPQAVAVEIVGQPGLGVRFVFAPHQTVYGGVGTAQQFVQQERAQKAGCAGEQNRPGAGKVGRQGGAALERRLQCRVLRPGGQRRSAHPATP